MVTRMEYLIIAVFLFLVTLCVLDGTFAFYREIKRERKKEKFINKETLHINKEGSFMRIYEELPCGCLVSEDGGGALIPCCYPEMEQEETELHKKCMKLYFEEGKTPKEIRKLFERKQI